jgi:hypothetical protein
MDTNSIQNNLPVIRFSFNWNNKLTNRAFTTLRIHNPNKYVVGQHYEIELKGQPKGTATLTQKRVIRLAELNDFICYLDTGYNRNETIAIIKRMYKGIDINAMMDFCLLVYDSEPEKNPQLGIVF